MAGPFYVSLDGAWAAAQTGLDHAGNEWMGPYGFQEAADTAVAGEIVNAENTAAMARLCIVTCGKDVSGWTIGAALRNDTGDGDHWTGVLCEVNAGANTKLLVELAVGKIVTDVSSNLADGIENTTDADTTTLSAVISEPIRWDTNEGTAAAGHIRFVGVTAAWADDGTRAVFDGANCSANTDIWVGGIGGQHDFMYWKNFELKNAARHGVNRMPAGFSNFFYSILHNIYIHDCTSLGVEWADCKQNFWLKCRIENCANGINKPGQANFFAACTVSDHTGYGIDQDQGVFYLGTVFYNNGTWGSRSTSTGTAFAHCVLDSNGDAGGYATNAAFPMYFGVRATNHSGAGDFGIEAGAGGAFTHSPYAYCYFEDNDTNYTATFVDVEGSDEDQADTNAGYTTAGTDFNLRTDATLHNTPVELNG